MVSNSIPLLALGLVLVLSIVSAERRPNDNIATRRQSTASRVESLRRLRNTSIRDAAKDAAKALEKQQKDAEKARKEAEKDAEKAGEKAEKAQKELEKNCGPLLASFNQVVLERDDALIEIRDLRTTCGDLGQREIDLNRRARLLDERELVVDENALDVAAREDELLARKLQLDEREQELDTREDNIPKCMPVKPSPSPSMAATPQPSPASSPPPSNGGGGPKAAVCEACGRCLNGLECINGVCQRADSSAPRCTTGESCGVGEQRVCRQLKSSDLASPRMLTKPLKDTGNFIGVTDPIRGCVMGKVRFNCDRTDEVCAGEAFCLEQTVQECLDDGLTETTQDVPIGLVLARQSRISRLSSRQLEGGDPSCCVLVVPLDCFKDELCQCKPRRKR